MQCEYAINFQVAYNAGYWDLAKKSFNVLWNHFVVGVNMFKDSSVIKSARENLELNQHQ